MLLGIGWVLLWSSVPAGQAQGNGYSLRFYGHGVDDIDRVKIPVEPHTPVDVGGNDFTFEFWMKAYDADNNTGQYITCGDNNDWILGNIVIDRDRFSSGGRKYGISINQDGTLVWGVVNANDQARTLCGLLNVLDGQWHHVAAQRRRSDGWLWLFVDGNLEGQVDGPNGDLSYPDGVPPSTPGGEWCQGPGGSWGGECINDWYIIIGAEKHDAGSAYPSYSGWLDEVRLSIVLRYPTNGSGFARPTSSFTADANTLGLYHFDEGPAGACLGTVSDSSVLVGGPTHGICSYGGSGIAGPEYSTSVPFVSPPPIPGPYRQYLPFIVRP
jgi:hypothetical protein